MQKASINDHCTYNKDSIEFDCKSYVDLSKMTLVVQSKYTDSERNWKTVQVDLCSVSTAIELAGTAITTPCAEFLFRALNAGTLNLERHPTNGRVADGRVTSVICTKFPATWFLQHIRH